MLPSFRWLASGTTVALAALAAPVHATVIDFEDEMLIGSYVPGIDPDTFEQNGFQMRQFGDTGTVDFRTSLPVGVAPTNNSSLFYSSLNTGSLEITNLNGAVFSLDGFDAAFIPIPGGQAQQIGVVALGFTAASSKVPSAAFYFNLGDTSATTHGYPFLTFASSTFANYKNLVAVDFYSCVIAPTVCEIGSQNNGQFALDNIRLTAAVTPVPEPETFALMAAGLAALGLVRRRRAR